MTATDWIFTIGLALLASFTAFAYGSSDEDDPSGRERNSQRTDKRDGRIESGLTPIGPAQA